MENQKFDISQKALSLLDLSSGLFVLAYGLCLAFFVFISEHLVPVVRIFKKENAIVVKKEENDTANNVPIDKRSPALKPIDTRIVIDNKKRNVTIKIEENVPTLSMKKVSPGLKPVTNRIVIKKRINIRPLAKPQQPYSAPKQWRCRIQLS